METFPFRKITCSGDFLSPWKSVRERCPSLARSPSARAAEVLVRLLGPVLPAVPGGGHHGGRGAGGTGLRPRGAAPGDVLAGTRSSAGGVSPATGCKR